MARVDQTSNPGRETKGIFYPIAELNRLAVRAQEKKG